MEFIDSFMLSLSDITTKFNTVTSIVLAVFYLSIAYLIIRFVTERAEKQQAKLIQSQGQKQMLNHFIKRMS